jgi:hypothetical protein
MPHMCGRYVQTMPADATRQLFRTEGTALIGPHRAVRGAGRVEAGGRAAKTGTNTSSAGGLKPSEAYVHQRL